MTRHTFKLIRPEVPDGFTVEYTDFPFDLPPDKADQALTLLARNMDPERHRPGQVKTIRVAGHPARELTMLKAGIATPVMRTRVCLVGRRLYTFGVATTPEEEHSPKVARFLDSFRLVPR